MTMRSLHFGAKDCGFDIIRGVKNISTFLFAFPALRDPARNYVYVDKTAQLQCLDPHRRRPALREGRATGVIG